MDYVTGMVRTGCAAHLFRRVPLQPGPLGIDLQHVATRGGQDRAQARLGQQQGQLGMRDHAVQALLRIGGIQWHVTGAGLDDAQQGHHGFRRAIQTQPDAGVWPCAARLEQGRDLVGLLAQLGIGPGLRAQLHRHRIRRGAGGAVDPLTQILIDGIVAARAGQLIQQAGPLGFIDKRNTFQRRPGVARQVTDEGGAESGQLACPCFGQRN